MKNALVSFLPGVLTRNWKLKLAALGLALLLWTSLRVEALDRQSLPSVPVRIQLNDPQWAVQNGPTPASVEVAFSGPARELFSINLERPTVTIPVDRVASADTSVLLRSEWVRLPNRPNVTVEEIRPRTISVRFERITQAVAPVAIRTQGSLPVDVAFVDTLSSEPEVVRISGPASQVEAVDSVPIQALDLSRVTSTGSRRLPVDTTGLYGLVISPGAVRVDYAVGEQVERTLSEVPIVPPEVESEVQLEPVTASVTVTGARSLVEGLDAGSVWMEVPPGQLTNLQPGQEREVEVEIRGIPDLLVARSPVATVTARRPESSAP